jgi:ABC-type phosphate transport system substrate-binding protein
MSKIRAGLAVLALLLGAGRLSAQGYVVVVNAANPATSLKKDRASSMFLKRLARWDDGNAVVPVNLNGSSPTRDAFSRAVHGKAASAIESYWQQQIFAGKEAPPAERGGDADVLAFVRANPGAIGYVSTGTALGGDVKAIPLSQ